MADSVCLTKHCDVAEITTYGDLARGFDKAISLEDGCLLQRASDSDEHWQLATAK